MLYLGETLPNNMIPLKITTGRKLLDDSVIKNVKMVKHFQRQIGRTNCGPASLALIINSINAVLRFKLSDPNISDKEEKYLMQNLEDGKELLVNENDIINHGLIRDYIQEINVAEKGMTLLELEHVIDLLGFGVNTYFTYNDSLQLSQENTKKLHELVSEGSNRFILKDHEEFQTFVAKHLTRPNNGILLNYHMAKLGFVEFKGHHSPIAALENDSILVMDVWPHTQPAWVDSKLLYDSMCSNDNDGGMPRGLLQIYELV